MCAEINDEVVAGPADLAKRFLREAAKSMHGVKLQLEDAARQLSPDTALVEHLAEHGVTREALEKLEAQAHQLVVLFDADVLNHQGATGEPGGD